jgi:enoyl-CoA hydratase/carnithine racemase
VTSPPTYDTVDLTVDGRLATLALDRPEHLNPLSTATLIELTDAAEWLDRHSEADVVVVTGRGRAFSSGADMAGFGGGDLPESGEEGQASEGGASRGGGSEGSRPRTFDTWRNGEAGRRMADAVERMRQVTLAVIRGHCIGGGVVLASACDMRIAADDTNFLIPELALGVPLTWGGVPRLMREIGPAMTRELVMTARPFDGREAKEIGFLNRAVPEADLDATADEIVGRLLEMSTYTLEVSKHQMRALAEDLVGVSSAAADANMLVTARGDAESRQVARTYIERFRTKNPRPG